jgi:GNAT superfamily N-acetyltransferase
MIIRRAKFKDIPILSQFAVDLLKYHEEFDVYYAPAKNVKEEYIKYFKFCIRSSLKLLLVAEAEGKLIGYALAEINGRPSVFKIRNIALINDMFIVEKMRNSGIGKKMYLEIIEWVKGQRKKYPKLDYVELGVHTKNVIGKKAWLKYGFEEYMSKQRIKI